MDRGDGRGAAGEKIFRNCRKRDHSAHVAYTSPSGSVRRWRSSITSPSRRRGTRSSFRIRICSLSAKPSRRWKRGGARRRRMVMVPAARLRQSARSARQPSSYGNFSNARADLGVREDAPAPESDHQSRCLVEVGSRTSTPSLELNDEISMGWSTPHRRGTAGAFE